MIEQVSVDEREIDLTELLAAIWAHKFLVSIIVCVCVFIAGYKAINTSKEYTATAIFEIDQNDQNNGFSLPNEVTAIAAIAGLGNSSFGNYDILLERVASKEFINQFSKDVKLENDTFFNTFNPNFKDPLWKAKIKQIIGWQTPVTDANPVIKQGIIDNFRKYVETSTTKGGAITISVTHEEPNLAAFYANEIMESIRKLIEKEDSEAKELRLSYLSNTLADALQEMENAQQNLKSFTLQDNARARETFISGALKLDQLRAEQIEAKEFSEILIILEEIILNRNRNKATYEAFRNDHPIIDDVRFRRILGMSETISAWTWPDQKTISAVSATLADRIKRLDIEIYDLEEKAKVSASSAETLEKLVRETKIAEATYTVLIEQVKSQSLAAGFKPESFLVFEYATAPLSTSAPNRKFIIAIGLGLGLFFGFTVALLNALRTGVYYSRSAVIKGCKSDLNHKSKLIRRLAKMKPTNIEKYLKNYSSPELDELSIHLSSKRLIYVANSKSRYKTNGTTYLLASKSASTGRKVLICDTSQWKQKNANDQPKSSFEPSFSTTPGKVDFVNSRAIEEGSFFSSIEFEKEIAKFMTTYDQVFFCTNSKFSVTALKALLPFNPYLIVLARPKKTVKTEINMIKAIQPIGILLHE